MIFEDVTLNNLGAFKGMHSLDLSIADLGRRLPANSYNFRKQRRPDS